MTSSAGPRPRCRVSAVAVFGGGAMALAALGWSVFEVVQRPLDGLPGASSEADVAPPGPPKTATLFDSVASVADAVMHDGDWFLLDVRISRVHRISSGSDRWSAFARPGDGPGELRQPRALAVHGDTIVVALRHRLQLYWPDGAHVGGRRVEPPRICRDARLGDLPAELSDVASSPQGLLLLFTCMTGAARGGVFLETGEASYRQVVRGLADKDADLLDPWRGMSVLAAHPSGFVFGHPEDECIGLFGLGGRRLRSFCHARLDRAPVPRAVTRQIPAQVPGSDARVRVPQRYLPFDRVFVRSDGTLLYRTPVPQVALGSAEVQMTFRLTEFDGAGGSPLSVPPAVGVFASDRAVLTAWDDWRGTWMAFYSLDRDG